MFVVLFEVEVCCSGLWLVGLSSHICFISLIDLVEFRRADLTWRSETLTWRSETLTDLELSQVTVRRRWTRAILVAEEEEEGELADGK